MNDYRHINKNYEPKHYKTRKSWEDYASWLRREMSVSLALAPEPQRPALKPKIFGKWEGDGYTCEKVYFETLPGFYVTGNLFRPSKPSKRMPVVLSPHGHWPDGRLHDRDPLGSVIARCISFARMGALVFSQDMVGYNDSCQIPHRQFPTDSQFGMSMMALHTWNSIRLLDFLLELPGADSSRVAVTGESGGGTQTFVLCGVDDRPTVSAPIVMVSYSMQGGCLCENAPLLRVGATSVDIARLFAPKPMFMGSCTKDWTRDTPKLEYPALREIYGLYGASGRLANLHVDDYHNYNLEMRENVYGFFNKFLFGKKSALPIKEADVSRPSHRDRMVFWGLKAPEPIPYSRFQKMWRDRTERTLRPFLKSPEAARKNLGPLLPHALGITPGSLDEYAGKKARYIKVTQEGDTLIIAPVAAEPDPEAGKIVYFDAYNRTPFSEKIHEILAAIGKTDGIVSLRGVGSAGPACLAATAVSPKVKSVVADMSGFNPNRDGDWDKLLGTPCLRQIGGLELIFSMIGKRPTMLNGATDEVNSIRKKYCL
jgi:cephalosporin-C deacetylase-like acetyl esterase